MLTGDKMRISFFNFSRHISHPTTKIVNVVVTLDHIILVYCLGRKIINLFAVDLRFVLIALVQQCFLSLSLVFLPHSIHFTLPIFQTSNGSNIHLYCWGSLSRRESWIVCHVRLLMLAFYEMVGGAVCHPGTVDADTHSQITEASLSLKSYDE